MKRKILVGVFVLFASVFGAYAYKIIPPLVSADVSHLNLYNQVDNPKQIKGAVIYLPGTGVNSRTANMLPVFLWPLNYEGYRLYRLNISDETYKKYEDFLSYYLKTLFWFFKHVRGYEEIVIMGQGEGAQLAHDYINTVLPHYVDAAIIASLYRAPKTLDLSKSADIPVFYMFFDQGKEKANKHRKALAQDILKQLETTSRSYYMILDQPAGFTGNGSPWLYVFDYAYGHCFRAMIGVGEDVITSVLGEDSDMLGSGRIICQRTALGKDEERLEWRGKVKHLENVPILNHKEIDELIGGPLEFILMNFYSSELSQINFQLNGNYYEEYLIHSKSESIVNGSWKVEGKELCFGGECYNVYLWSDLVLILVDSTTDQVKYYLSPAL